jgi:sugar phosphate isomerase/epimerase
VWGDGDPEGVRQRAAQEMKDCARAAAKFGVKTVTGFTGSSIWHSIYAFPPTSQAYWDKGFADFAARWTPILDVFDEVDVDFALEIHPTEIAFDLASMQRALEANSTNASASISTPATSAIRVSITSSSCARSATACATYT